MLTRLKQILEDILSNLAFIKSINHCEQIKSSYSLIFKRPKRSSSRVYYNFIFSALSKPLFHLGGIEKAKTDRQKGKLCSLESFRDFRLKLYVLLILFECILDLSFFMEKK